LIGVVLGANLQVLDTTMATVALPRMQGPLSATQDEITWVLTAYLVAVAVALPLVGVLANRFGRKRVFLSAIVCFISASALTGMSDSLAEIVAYRFIQGLCASPFVPLSQSFVLDSYPPEKRGTAMSWWTIGLMFGMMAGPTMGGYVTEFHSWRWAFYLNVPGGLLSFVLVLVFAPGRRRPDADRPFGLTGYLLFATGLVSLQLMLSRGERMDWFVAPEMVAAAGLAMVAFYLFVVHTATSAKPFVDPHMFRDRNLIIGLVLMFILGAHWLSMLSLLSAYMQTMAGYPVVIAGVVLVPQAAAAGISAFIVGRLISRIGPRLPMILGMSLIAFTTWRFSTFTPAFERHDLITNIMMQGAGMSLYFVPLTVATFSTLEARYTDVGTSLYSLMRNFGSGMGASLTVAFLVRSTQSNRVALAEHVTPFNEVLRHIILPEVWRLDTVTGLAALNAEVTRQAVIVAYASDFRILSLVVLAAIPLALLLRVPRTVGAAPQ
jgi:DHA2 family multidrug resistance protein